MKLLKLGTCRIIVWTERKNFKCILLERPMDEYVRLGIPKDYKARTLKALRDSKFDIFDYKRMWKQENKDLSELVGQVSEYHEVLVPVYSRNRDVKKIRKILRRIGLSTLSWCGPRKGQFVLR